MNKPILRLLFWLTIGMATLAPVVFVSAQSVFYVTPAGSGVADGTSWTNAAAGADLQSMIDNASVGDSVWVACGTYYPTITTDRSIAFHMRDGIAIIGSFAGGEESIAERALTCGPCSELNGDIGTPGVEFDNSYKVIVNIGLNTTAVIDGFRIVNGYDNRTVQSIEVGLGGGVYNGGAGTGGEGGICSPTFRNCVIEQNYAAYGSGMFNNGHAGGNSAPVLYNCVLANNHATIGGGGMDSYGWNNGYVAPEMYNCVFFGNTSDSRAGAMYCWGGQNGNCSPTISSCAFINNSSVAIAGGIIVDNSEDLAGNPPFTGVAEVTCTNSIFRGNTSGAGPQFYILGSGNFIATYTAIDTVGQTLDHPISGPGTGNLFINPQLLNTTDGPGPDLCWMTQDDGLSLSIASPAINAGDTGITDSLDLTHHMRISGARVDIGPYEFPLPDTVAWTGTVDSDWFTHANWAPGRVPDSLQVVIVPGIGAAPNQPVIAADTAYCAGVVADSNAVLLVGERLRIRERPPD